MRKFIAFTLLMASLMASSQEKKVSETEIEINPLLKGTLFSPETTGSKTKLVILVAGSGPTNRNGNQLGMPNNSLKFLAEGLAKDGNAVFSYDKRSIALAIAGKADESSMRFEDFISDTKEVITYFRAKKQYAKIIVAGHSEGALIGLVASEDHNADGYVSLAGAGRPIDEIIVDQIAAQLPTLREESRNNFDKMRKGETFEANPMLQSIFHDSVRPYLLSWMKYNPADEIRKLKIPVLIVNGTKDLQVKVPEAELLKKAKPDAKLAIIDNMNHVFKEIKGDDTENFQSYKNPDLPVIPALIDAVNQFIKSI